MNLEQLLDQWYKLEPARCEYSTIDDKYTIMCGGGTLHIRHIDKSGPMTLIGYDMHNLQGAVQEAIKERGWDWIKMTSNILILDGKNLTLSDGRLTDNLPFDLLSAYIHALTTTIN